MRQRDYYVLNRERLAKVIPIFIAVAAFYLAVFTPLIALVLKNWLLLVVHLIDIGIVAWAYLWFRTQHDIRHVSFALSVAAYITVVSVMLTNGVAQSGIFLAFPYVPFIAFMRDPRSARRWMSGLLLTMLAALALSAGSRLTLPYSRATFALYIVNYLIILIIIFGYIAEKEEADQMFQHQLQQLDMVNAELNKALAERSKALRKLEHQAAELEKFNTVMVDRELRMIELKRQLKQARQGRQ